MPDHCSDVPCPACDGKGTFTAKYVWTCDLCVGLKTVSATKAARWKAPDFVRKAGLVEDCCRVMHDAYEAAAVAAGWETQRRSQVPWDDLPRANRVAMRAAVRALLAHLGWPVPGTYMQIIQEQADLLTARNTLLDAVEALHVEQPLGRVGAFCVACSREWPCPTIRAMRGERA